MSNPKVRKAVIAAAGFGTRFLPQTKAMPKEMLPIINKPVIQYIVEQLIEAGIEDIIIVTGYHKRSIEDHFDTVSADLKENLIAGNKTELLAEIESIPNMANFAYIRQKGLYGSTTPILNAAHLLGGEPFIYTFADDLFVGQANRFTQMIELYEEFGSPILPCITLEDEADYKRYGIVVGEAIRDGVVKASRILEKPGKEAAPSNLASVGGYLLTPEVLEYARKAQADVPVGDEFYLTTYVLQKMMDEGKATYGCALEHDNYYDTGNTLGYLKTVIDVALKDKNLSTELKQYIQTLL